MDLAKEFLCFIKKENLFQSKDKLIIGVSGGIDSVVLCELCNQAHFNFSIAHCNFKLRGEESERDELFVRSLSEKYKVEVFIKSFETEIFAKENKVSIQVAARDLRYKWFKELSLQTFIPQTTNNKQQITNNHQRPYILTAHHANDNIETLLMNFFRGTGINGLRAILPKKDIIIRPLLFATKQEILNFAGENNLSFVEDSSNTSDKYTRNYFRNQIIPSIEKVYPKVEGNLRNNIYRFKEIDMLYQQSIINLKKKLIEHKGDEIHIPVLKLLKSKPLFTIVYEIINEFNFTSHQTDDVINLLTAETGKYVQSSTHRILKNRNWLIIAPNNTSLAQNILMEETDNIIEFANGKLKFDKLSTISYQPDSYRVSTENIVAWLDAEEIKFPLLLRKWKTGDYFYPLGMQKKKKLNRFFIDQKLSAPEKENVWVVEMNKKILWVVGKRIDDRFKITLKTKNILRISLC
ncbi:MAG: tRNA lysidine(34) synthetase TilS [Ginsengibacter sp.]